MGKHKVNRVRRGLAALAVAGLAAVGVAPAANAGKAQPVFGVSCHPGGISGLSWSNDHVAQVGFYWFISGGGTDQSNPLTGTHKPSGSVTVSTPVGATNLQVTVYRWNGTTQYLGTTPCT